MSPYTSNPLEAQIRQDHERRLVELVREGMLHMPEPAPWELCDIGLVHHEKGVYWLGTTTGCSLLPFVRSNTAILNIHRPPQGSPLERHWDVEWALYETRAYLEHAIDVFDHCEHTQIGDTRSETYALASRLSFVRVNSFMALEKSLKTLWSVGHKHDRPQFRHQVHCIFTDLPDDVRASLLMNLQDVRFFRYPIPNPTSDQVDEYLEWAENTYMDWRYFESSGKTDMDWNLPGLEIRLTISALFTLFELLSPPV